MREDGRLSARGSVQRSANRVRATAQLIDARTDVHVRAEHYERDLTDAFAIQTDTQLVNITPTLGIHDRVPSKENVERIELHAGRRASVC